MPFVCSCHFRANPNSTGSGFIALAMFTRVNRVCRRVVPDDRSTRITALYEKPLAGPSGSLSTVVCTKSKGRGECC